MEIIFPAPQFLLWIMIGIYVIAVPPIFLKKGKWPVKIIMCIIVTIICGGLLFFFYRDTKLAVTDSGLYSNNYGEFTIKWEEIDRAFMIDDLKNSEYRPSVRTNGYSLGNVGFGWFALKNGKSARVVLQTRTRCLVVIADDRTFLFAPVDFDAFLHVVERYINVSAYEEKHDD
ncbi:MAG: hypothetical protein JXB88_03375 [Spirochaetales bacterium]|nr:hypothetical protein [Spirochaetales bacterium]